MYRHEMGTELAQKRHKVCTEWAHKLVTKSVHVVSLIITNTNAYNIIHYIAVSYIAPYCTTTQEHSNTEHTVTYNPPYLLSPLFELHEDKNITVFESAFFTIITMYYQLIKLNKYCCYCWRGFFTTPVQQTLNNFSSRIVRPHNQNNKEEIKMNEEINTTQLLTLAPIPDAELQVIASVSQSDMGKCWKFYFDLHQAAVTEQDRRKRKDNEVTPFQLPGLIGKDLDTAIIETFIRRDAFDVLGATKTGTFFQAIAAVLIDQREQQKTQH